MNSKLQDRIKMSILGLPLDSIGVNRNKEHEIAFDKDEAKEFECDTVFINYDYTLTEKETRVQTYEHPAEYRQTVEFTVNEICLIQDGIPTEVIKNPDGFDFTDIWDC